MAVFLLGQEMEIPLLKVKGELFPAGNTSFLFRR